jgi:hypothetical protein
VSKPNRNRKHEYHCPLSPEEKAHLAVFAAADDRPLSVWALRVALGAERAPRPYIGGEGQMWTTSIHIHATEAERDAMRAQAGERPVILWLRDVLIGTRTTSTAPPRKVRGRAQLEA